MRSWNLCSFVDEFGGQSAADVWGVSQQAVSMAVRNERNIQFILLDGFYEVRESKILNRIHESRVTL